MRELAPADAGVKTVNGLRYSIDGLLGHSRFAAWLGRNSLCETIVIKEATGLSANAHARSMIAALAYYEIACTAFYEAQGELVPSIVDVEILEDSITIVKAYVEGLTSDEARHHEGIADKEKSRLAEEANVFLGHLRAVFGDRLDESGMPILSEPSNFERWLGDHRADVERRFPTAVKLREIVARDASGKSQELLDLKVRLGDASERNILWRPRTGKWILFDP